MTGEKLLRFAKLSMMVPVESEQCLQLLGHEKNAMDMSLYKPALLFQRGQRSDRGLWQ